MRLRRKPEARAFLEAHPEYVMTGPVTDEHELYVEVGMGKGSFIIEMARRNPQYHYIGIEKYDTVLYTALKKILNAAPLDNVKIMTADARDVAMIFAPHSVAGLYLNFSDPWPKRRHYKRRLTYRDYLQQYEQILKPGAKIVMKTDNRTLFEFTLMEMAAYPMDLQDICLDLHHDERGADNIMTEYEEKFGMDHPVYRVIASYKKE